MAMPLNFSRYLHIAQAFLARGRLPALLLAVTRKASKGGLRMRPLQDDLKLMRALCVAWWRGEYREVDRQTLLAVMAALVYFITPVDAVPDWVLMLGLLDDLAVLGWVLRRWRSELDTFRDWYDAQPRDRQQMLQQLPELPERVVAENPPVNS